MTIYSDATAGDMVGVTAVGTTAISMDRTAATMAAPYKPSLQITLAVSVAPDVEH